MKSFPTRRARKGFWPPPLAAAALAALAAFFAFTGIARSDETYKVTPSISASETYDSNVNFLGKGDFEHSVTPGVRVDMQKQRMAAWAQAKAAGFKYSKLSKYDRVDQNYEAGVQVNATETLGFEVKGGVVADHAYTYALAETGQLASTASHQQYTFQPSMNLALTENTMLTLLYNFSKAVYDTQDYTDNVSHTVAAVLGYRLNERLQLLTQLADTRMDNDSAKYNSYSLMGGFEYTLLESLKARVLVGGSSTNVSPKTVDKRHYTSYSADSTLDWRFERSYLNAGYSRDVTMSVYGDDRLRHRFSLYGGYSLTERLTAQFGGNIVISKDQSTSSSNQSNRWYEFGPTMEYMLGEKTKLALGYAYGTTKDQESDILRNRNRIFLNFNTSF
jgi:hypothetical protein